jgi:hypothetical protein
VVHRAVDVHRERDGVEQSRQAEHGVLAGWMGTVDAYLEAEPQLSRGLDEQRGIAVDAPRRRLGGH